MATVEFRHIQKVYAGHAPVIHDLSLRIDEGEFMVLVGPSGSGKSTVMRLLAGLDPVTAGDILIDDQRVNDWPPQRRNVAMVFQNYALYPHMSVRRNLAFPLKMAGLKRQAIEQRVNEAAALLDLTALLDRKPAQLSGGQRQRVAMGRAIVRNPRVFLMDEPLSNLDARLRVQIRTEIGVLQRRTRTTTLYVTHDQVEAMTLGDRVAVLRDGRLQQVAPPQALYDRPANAFVAAFLGNPGMNLLPAALARRDAQTVLKLGGQMFPLDEIPLPLDQPMIAGIRPEALSLANGADTPALAVEVEAVEALGHEQLVYGRLTGLSSELAAASLPSLDALDLTPGRLTARLAADARLSAGTLMSLAIRPQQLYLFDAQGNALWPSG